VEGDNDLAKVMLATLERAGLDVCHAPTRRKALELCVTAPPHLIVLDPALPDGDGFSLVDWLRGQKDLSQIPLVVYSARDIEEDERIKLLLGPTEFLTKARVQPHEVETVILTMLRRRHAIVEDNLHWDGATSANL
jgi:DNA-binding response OmpR family regulator